MKADVTPTDERKKEALEWATKFFEIEAAFLTREGSAPNLPEIARNSAAVWLALPPEYREPLLVQLIRCSLIDGDGYCTMILIELVTIFIAMDRPLPDLLKGFTHIRLRYPDVKWRTETETSGEERTAVGAIDQTQARP